MRSGYGEYLCRRVDQRAVIRGGNALGRQIHTRQHRGPSIPFGCRLTPLRMTFFILRDSNQEIHTLRFAIKNLPG